MSDWIEYWHSKKGGDVTWGLDGNGLVARKYGVVVLGQMVVINRNGRVVYNGGPLDYESLAQFVEGS